ncbi:putative secondary metabolism biosynthetic enzyme [Lepraria neglecta]|uniref:Secondary metabolism biosynthetic enzyme n=1 Tax=Lepraria neglecta TaxID=209136 RepID=A0AAD9Z3E3_9LECA|nr:putative secondary metabolism biosynthetic enzyme [Lepraria neglecta]
MSQIDRQALLDNATALGSYGLLIRRIGESLAAILQGQAEPLALMLEDDLLSRFYAEFNSYQLRYTAAASYIERLAYQNPALRLIEIGGGTASATVPVLEALGGGATERTATFAAYDFTDITSGFFETAKAKLSPWGQLVNYRKLDIESPPANQGFEAGSYDVVVASDVLHATADMRRTMTNVRSLLKPGGNLVLVEETGCGKRVRWLPFATLPGWWLDDQRNGGDHGGGLNEQIRREDGPLMAEDQWDISFSASGFSGLDGAVQDYPDHPEQCASVMFTTAWPWETETPTLKHDIVIIGQTIPGGHFWSEMEVMLQKHSRGAVTWLNHSGMEDFVFEGQHCIFLDDPKHQYLTTMDSKCFQGLQRLLQCAGVLWITGGLDTPNAGMVNGLCRAIRSENPNTIIVTFAIDDWTTPRKEVAALISDVFERSFCSAFEDTEHDTELAEKEGLVCVPRFTHSIAMDKCLNRESCHDSKDLQLLSQPGRPLKLTISNPGSLDTLCFIDDETAAAELLDDEIEINIKASGLNFKDVILALGQLASNYLGQECSGVVTRVGQAVTNIEGGDRVCCATENSIANIGRCKAACATPIPDSMSYLEAASLPIVYCTAQYCLSYIARLQFGETILIHAAAGGVGQAAIMLAQATKAKILATVGSLEKKTFLMQKYKIPKESIFYSRDTSFAQGVLDATGQKGVDVALNSLAGEQLRATWECMAPFGRFVEIGKRDITNNMNLEMSRFERNVSFTAVDLADLINHRTHILQQLLVEIMDLFERGFIRAVSPIHEFGISEVETAFRSLQSGKLMGKLVIVPKEDEMVMDVLFDHAEYSDWMQVIEPKVHGAWNLHSTLLSQPLDFFILLSSASGIVGNRGQAAYAAASSFLDSFAHFRASKGLPATAIDLGVVSEIGWVAERPEMQENLEALTGGSPNLTEADVLALIKLAVTGQIDRLADHQTTVGLSFDKYHPDHPSAFWASDARFSHLRRAAVAATSTTTTATVQATPKQALKAAHSAEEATTVATQGLLTKISSVLIVPAEEITVNKPVVALGLNSLIAVEIRSWITREMEAAMTTMELMTAGSIGAVADMVVVRSKLCEGLRKGEGG